MKYINIRKLMFSLNTINYTKIPDQLLQNTKLNLSSRVIYARLVYRMNLSVNNDKAFYDNKQHFYYVVYQIKDLMHDCGLGRTTVINSLKQLVNYGLVVKHRLIHLVRLELPKYQVQTSTNQESKPVKRIKTKTNNRYDSKYDNRLKGVENRKHTNTIKMPEYDTKLDQQNTDKASKSMSIPKAVTDMMARNLGGKTLYKCIHILTITSRKHIIKKYHNTKWAKYALDYDINEYYKYNHGHNFAKYIDHGLRKAFHDAHNMYSYFMTVCKKYYKYAITWFHQNQDVQVINGPRIPIFKI